MQKTYKFPNILNFRDLGGYDTAYGVTKSGIIFRSAGLDRANDEDVKKLMSLGIKTVIDFRSEYEQEKRPDYILQHQHIKHISLPVPGNGRYPKNEADVGPMYLEMLSDHAQIKKILQALIISPKPLLFHCAIGKDRTGMIANLLLDIAGVDIADRQAHYLESFAQLRSLVLSHPERYQAIDFPAALITPSMKYLEDFYDLFIAQYESFAYYLNVIGLSKIEQDKLKKILF